MAHRIQPGWRYSLAQLALWALFGRRWHFISPWSMVGVGAGVAFLSPNGQRVLIQQRAGKIENVGQWGTFGGYVNTQQHEPIVQGMVREVYEECGLRLDPSNFPASAPYTPVVYGSEKIAMAQHNGVAFFWYAYTDDNIIERMQVTEEVSAYRWVTLQELENMWDDGLISGAENDHYGALRAALAAAKAGQAIPTARWL